LGPVSIQVWGLLVALGLVAALLVASREIRRRRLPVDALYDLAVYFLIPSFVLARVFYVLFYDRSSVPFGIETVWNWLAVWRGGLSSFGGFFGAVAGLFLFRRRYRIDVWPYLEALAFAFPLGYGIGRLGCFLIHDHLGIPSSFWLAVSFPDGSRLDHGLLLSLFGFSLFGVFTWLKIRKVGQDRVFFLPLLLVAYGTFRFGLDFLRAWDGLSAETRYLYLTPAQYGSVILVVVGVLLFRRCRLAPQA